MKKNFKSYPTILKKVDGRTVTGFASVFGNEDSYDDIVHLGSFKKTIKERSDRFRHLWQHDFTQPPTARITDIREVKRPDLPEELQEKYPEVTGALQVSREYLRTPRGEEAFEAVSSGAVNEMSFAFDIIKYDWERIEDEDGKFVRSRRHIREIRLWETSDVLWGANDATIASKCVVDFSDTGYLPEETNWENPKLSDFTELSWEELPEAEKERIRAHYAWSGLEDSFESLKCPHHQPSRSGVGKAVWKGVQSQMEQLMSIPTIERRVAYDHLIQHYKGLGKTAPAWSWMELLSAIQGVQSAPLIIPSKDLEFLQSIQVKIVGGGPGAEPEQLLATDLERRLLQQRINLAKLEMNNYE